MILNNINFNVPLLNYYFYSLFKRFLLKNMLNHESDTHLKLKCLLKYGSWMAETKSLDAKEIIEEYFQKVLNRQEN